MIHINAILLRGLVPAIFCASNVTRAGFGHVDIDPADALERLVLLAPATPATIFLMEQGEVRGDEPHESREKKVTHRSYSTMVANEGKDIISHRYTGEIFVTGN